MRTLIEELGIKDEIKWQKVNEYHYEKYVRLVDVLFDLAKEDKLKIRIFSATTNMHPQDFLLRKEKRIIRCYITNLSNMHSDSHTPKMENSIR